MQIMQKWKGQKAGNGEQSARGTSSNQTQHFLNLEKGVVYQSDEGQDMGKPSYFALGCL